MAYEPAATAVQAPATARTPSDAVAALERAVGRDPSDLGSWQRLGSAYVRRASETADPRFYQLAAGAFDRADALRGDDPVTALGRGTLALALHEFEQALELGLASLRALPGNADALAVVVDAEVELGRYDAAAAHLQEMLDTRPGLPALARVAYLRELHGDVAGAGEALRQAEAAGAASPFDVASIVALQGDLAFGQGRLDAAENAYRRALRGSPGLLAAEVGLARVRAARGEREGAISDLRALTERSPVPDAVTLLGDLAAREGYRDEAQGSYALVRAMITLQQDAGARVDLEAAEFEADHGDAGQAVELARRAHDARPTVQAADVLAWALLQSGDAHGAVPYVERALRLGTRDALVRFHAAAVFASVGDETRARFELQQSLASNRWSSFLHEDRARELADRLGVSTESA